MKRKEIAKQIFLISAIILIFASVLYLYQTSAVVKNEFYRICGSEYSIEKDKKGYDICLIPYYDEEATALIVIKLTSISTVLSLITFLVFKNEK